MLRHPGNLAQATPQLSDLREALTESRLPIRVDVVDRAAIPEHFRREIERAYVVVRAADA